MAKRYCLLVICIYFTIGSTYAQSYTPVEYLGIEHGLSNNAVTCIYQDRYGFMWFGTYDGLNKYDGYNFKVFRNQLDDSTSLISNRIVTISEDKNNNLWIGTKSGVSIYNYRTTKFSPGYYIPFGKSEKKKITAVINDIETDSEGNIFIATAGEALMVYSNDQQVAMQVPYLDGDALHTGYHVQAVTFDLQHRIWLFIQGYGLCMYDAASRVIKLVNNSVLTGNCLEAGDNRKLWLGSENGLFEFNKKENTFKAYHDAPGQLTANKVVDLCRDNKNNLWIATDGGGVNILNTTTGAISHLVPEQYKKSLTSASVYAIYEDKESRKWIGTLRGGINIIDLQKNKFKTIAHDPYNGNSLINNFVLSFCEDIDGSVWIGTDGGGISYWDRSKDSYTNYSHVQSNPKSVSNNFITSIVKDSHNEVWVATYGDGINLYNRKDHSFKRYRCIYSGNNEDKNVWKLYEDSYGNLWAGTCTGGRLYRYNKLVDNFELFDENLHDVITLAEDRHRNLWAGTFNSLIKIDTKDKKHEIFRPGSSVRAIYEDKAGNFWIGTEGGGLQQFDKKSHTFTRYTETNGLSANSVLNILEDKNSYLWVSTFNGLSKFDPSRKVFKNFYESDGLQSNQFSYNAALMSKTGEFLFGGIRGFNIFYPDSITSASSIPQMLLTGLKINNVPVEQDSVFTKGKSLFTIDKITLPYDKAMLSVDFVTLEYSAPDKISYAYYLEGWDKDWNYVGKLRTANYSRLNEGSYTLRIKSTNSEGIWNAAERVIQITVLPPWYRTWWAYIIYCCMAGAAIYFYLFYKNRQARLKYEIRIAHIHAEKEKELNEKKLSFFTNVAHEFRTPLTLIINPVKELLYSHGQVKDTGDLNIVYRNARRLLSLVDQLLLFRKAGSETGKLRLVKMNFSDLCKEVYLCFTYQARHKNVQYEFECREGIELYADREKIEISLFNLISNALKFTPEGGKVIFRVLENEKQVEVNITDTGCGIPEGTGSKLFEKFYQVHGNEVPLTSGFGIGLNVVKNFVEGHKGEISYTSQKDTGTTFCMKLLKGKEHFAGDLIFEDVTEHSVFIKELIEEVNYEPDVTTIPMAAKEEGNGNIFVSDNPSMLIVEDNIPVRQYMVQLFKNRFTLYEAGNGEDGLTLAQQFVPDIIISDVLMHGLSGIELCSRIRENPSLSHIPIILLTSSSSSDVKLKGIECGADDYITKPFDKELLLARVAGIMKSRNNLQKYFYNEITLQQNNLKISTEYKDFLEKCIAIVEQHLDNEDFNIKMLVTEIGMSHSNLYKKVKSVSGQSVNGFIRYIRLRKAAELFINTECNVNEAAFKVGISDSKYFREQFCKLFGMNPSEYIKKYRKPFQKHFTVHNKPVREK